MTDDQLLQILRDAADAVHESLATVTDWGPSGVRDGQYALDLVADAAALGILRGAGLAVLSEESGLTGDGPLLVVVDPVDGSTNASRGVPWYSTSLCVLDKDGPRIGLVHQQVTGVRYEAIRGEGALRDGAPIRPTECRELGEAIVAVSGLPDHNAGWAQLRMFGAASLDICAVAEGVVDAYTVGGESTLYPWDYLGGLLLCTEAGAVAVDGGGQNLVSRRADRRAPVVAATPELLTSLVGAAV